MYALRSCITTPLLTLLLLGLLTSCRHPNKSSDIQAHETLVHVQALLQSDSFPEKRLPANPFHPLFHPLRPAKKRTTTGSVTTFAMKRKGNCRPKAEYR